MVPKFWLRPAGRARYRNLEFLGRRPCLSIVRHKDRVVETGHREGTEFAEAQPRLATTQVGEEVPLFGEGKRRRLRGREPNVRLQQLQLDEIGHQESPAKKLFEKCDLASKVEIDNDAAVYRNRACRKPIQASLPVATPAPVCESRRRSGS